MTQLNRFRLLAAERKGAFGAEGLNARVETLLGVPTGDTWCRGRPVLITENDYELGFSMAISASHGRRRTAV